MRYVWWAGVLGASVLVGAQLARGGVAQSEDLADLSFMAGCWEGKFSASGASGTIAPEVLNLIGRKERGHEGAR